MARLRSRIAVSVASAVFVFGALELVLRIAGFVYPPHDDPLAIVNTAWNPELARDIASPDGAHRPSARQLWEPRPGAELPRLDGERINDAGYRGPLVPEERTPGVLRVATLGDSSCFGTFLPYADGYSAQLARMLGDAGVPSEVLCFGVIGHSARAGLERYRELV